MVASPEQQPSVLAMFTPSRKTLPGGNELSKSIMGVKSLRVPLHYSISAVVTTELFCKLFVSVHDPVTAFYLCFGGGIPYGAYCSA